MNRLQAVEIPSRFPNPNLDCSEQEGRAFYGGEALGQEGLIQIELD